MIIFFDIETDLRTVKHLSAGFNLANRKSEVRPPPLEERHSGFNVYCSNAIWPHNEDGKLSRKKIQPQTYVIFVPHDSRKIAEEIGETVGQ